MIRVLLADDHGLVREGLRGILAKGADIEVAAEAANGDEVLALVRKHEFDLALLDLSMPGLSGIALIKRLKVERPKLRILVLSMHGEAQYAARALKAGASGYLTKDSAAAQLLGAIRKIAAGGVQISETAAAQLIGASPTGDAPLHEVLSDREYEVLRQIVAGRTVTDIAEALSVSVKTISTHKARILQKLNLAGTADLVRYAIEHGLTDERA
ncbi:MAG TPA: response regulator transcription factor [Burkholderiales bacterium]|nr:response regulator transcription factor [Burkholderiales bacterium]